MRESSAQAAPMRALHVRAVSGETVDRIDEIARARHRSREAEIRFALEEHVRRECKKAAA